MALIDDIRKKFSWTSGKTDYEVADTLAKSTGQPAALVMSDLGIQQKNEAGLGTAFKNSLYSIPQGIGQLAGDFVPGLGNNNDLELYGREGTQRNPVTIMDGDGGALSNLASNLYNKPLNTMGQVAGSALGLMGPSGGAKLGLYGVRAARGLGELGKVGKAAEAVGETSLYGLPSYSQMRDTQEESGQNSAEDKLKALASAAGIGYIERLGGAEALLAGKNKATSSLGKTIVKQGLEEGAEEVAQTPLEQFGAGKDVFSYDTLDQAAAGGLAGFLGGSLSGPAAHFLGRKTEQPIPDNQPTDLLNTEPTGLQGTPLQLGYSNSKMIVFPDGSTGTQAQLDEYLGSLPEAQQVAVRAKLAGYAPQSVPNQAPSQGDLFSGDNTPVDYSEQPQVQQPPVRNLSGRQMDLVGQEPNAPLFVAPDGAVLNEQNKDAYVEFGSKAAQLKEAMAAQRQNEADTLTLYNNIAGTSYKKLNSKKAELFNQVTDLVKQGVVAPDSAELLSVVSKMEKGKYPAAMKDLAQLSQAQNTNVATQQGTAVAPVSQTGINGIITPQQSAFMTARVDPTNEGKSDAQLSKEFGFTRQNGSKLVKNAKGEILKATAKAWGVSEQEAEQLIRQRLKEQAPKAQAQENPAGLAPDQQQSVVDQAELFGNDEGATQSMGTIASTGDSQVGLGGEQLMPASYNPNDVTPSTNTVVHAQQERAVANEAIKGDTIWDYIPRSLNAHQIDIDDAAQDWNDNALKDEPYWDELPPEMQAAMVKSYIALQDKEINNEQYVRRQGEIANEAIELRGATSREASPTPAISAQNSENVEGRETQRTGSEESDIARKQAEINKRVQENIGSTTKFTDKNGREITLVLEDAGFGETNIVAYHNGKKVGSIGPSFDAREGMSFADSYVEEPFRRSGIASKMYDFAEDIGGVKFGQSGVASKDARAFWANRNRSLKSEGEGSTAIHVDGEISYGVAKFEAEQAFKDFGYSPLFQYANDIQISDLGKARGEISFPKTNDTFTVHLANSLISRADSGEISFVIRHEYSHGLDYVLGWALSDNPKMEINVYDDGSVEPVGTVATELVNFYNSATAKTTRGGELRKVLEYPLNREKFGELSSLDTQAELFAQLQSTWMYPEGQKIIRTFLPKTSKYLEQANEYAKHKLQTVADKRSTTNRETGEVSRRRGDSELRSNQETGSTGNQEKVTLSSMGDAYTIRPEIKDTWTKIGHFLKEISPKLLTSTQLVEQFGDKIKTLKRHVQIQNEMAAEQARLSKSASKVLEGWGTFAFKHKAANAKLMNLMNEATRLGIHPDESFDSEGNSHLQPSDYANYKKLTEQYKTLLPEAKTIYASSKKILTDNWAERKAIYAEVVTAAYNPRIEEATKRGDTKEADRLTHLRDKDIAEHARHIKDIKGPYFPLMRFGDYIVIGESKEIQELRDRMEQASGETYTKLAQEVAQLEKSSKHYVVEAFESRLDMEKRRDELARQGLQVREKKAEAYSQEIRPVTAGAVDRISSALTSQFDAKTAEKLKSLVTQMYVNALPENNALQRQMKRKGVAGSSLDMLRAFAETVERDSFYLSRMKYSKDLTSNLYAMQQETKRQGVDQQNVYNNIVARTDADHKYERTPVISALARFSSIFHLGIAPSFLLTNMTQPWFITLPQLAGTHGASRSMGAMRNAWTDATRIIKQAKGGTMFNLADTDLSTVKDPAERRLLTRLRDLNKLDADQILDMSRLSEGTNPAMIKAGKAFEWATHHIELVNRISTALATYRLEKAKDPLISEDKLIEKAINMVDATQLDYSAENAAYFMKPTVGLGAMNKLIFQFRKYQQGMLYLLFRNAQLAFKGDKEAMKSLGYLMGTQLMFAGTTGLPLTAPILFALGRFFDKDDEDGDVETQLRNFATDMVGADAARAFYKGLPAALGVDLSNNLGMGGLLKPFPMMQARDVTDASTGKDSVKEILFNAAGAPVGMIANIVDGMMLVGDGEIYKGLARMSPKFVGSFIKAAELSNNGLTTRSGTEVMSSDQFDGWDLAFKAAGFNPTSVSEHYEAQTAKEDTSHAIQDRRNRLLKDYAQARSKGEDISDVMGDIQAFNEEHTGSKINRSAMLKAVQTRTKAGGQMDEAGVQFRKNENNLKEIDRFAK